ncbi:MAG TPA: fumarylacetoacetate hydrolase family protein [Candidatus Dormibacteraeota bacterium]|nr:fumarylacetoacetate hydrolase family protein [Candidatus Dormibacteraeota bacterium]
MEYQAATPVGRPGKIVAVGKNYLDHVREMGGSAPTEVPVLFMKPPSAVLGDGEAILLPPQSERVDYEGELVAIIGERLHNVDAATALRGVRGYTCGNDVTARDLQAKDGQWTRAKGFDTFSPLGPGLVEGIDPSDLRITTRVNGEVRQESRTSLMIRPVGELIAFISSVMTLEPGDAIFTGTPAGVGPLQEGDVVEVEVEEVGVLRNPVRRAPA